MPETVERLEVEADGDVEKAVVSLKKLSVEADKAARDRRMNIKVDYDEAQSRAAVRGLNSVGNAASAAAGGGGAGGGGLSALTGAMGGFNTVARSFENIVGIIKFPALISGASLAATALNALAAGAVGLTSALAPLTGLLATIPQGLLLVGQGALTALLGVKPIIAAFQAWSKADDAARSTQKLTAAQNAQAVSARTLARAQKELQKAQDGINKAREEAANNITDLQFASEQAAIDEAQALRTLQKAQEDLSGVNQKLGKDTVEVTQVTDDFTGKIYEIGKKTGGVVDQLGEQADKILALRQAELSYKRAQEDRRRTDERLADATAKGIENSDAMVAAKDRLAYAQDSLAAATEANTKAMSGNNTAMDQFNTMMSKLGPNAQSLVKYLQSLKPTFEDLKKTASEALAPGIEAGIRAAAPFFDDLKSVLKSTGEAIGNIASAFGKWVGSDDFRSAFKLLSDSNTRIIQSLGDAALHFARGLINVAVAARPLTEWLGQLVRHSGELFDQWAAEGRSSGSLADFFARTRDTTEKLVRIFGDLYTGLKNVGRAATPLGTWMLDSLTNLTDKFREWTGQTDNLAKMTSIFDSYKAPLHEMAKLVGDIAKGWMTLGQNSGLAGIIAQIRTQLLPVLIQLGQSANSQFLPALVETLSQLVPIITTLMSTSGALTQFVKLIGLLAQGINKLVETVPGLGLFGSELSGVLGTMGILKKLGIGTAFLGIGAAAEGSAKKVGLLRGTLQGIAGASKGEGLLGFLSAAKTGFGDLGRSIGGFIKANAGLLAITATLTAVQMWGDMMSKAAKKGHEAASTWTKSLDEFSKTASFDDYTAKLKIVDQQVQNLSDTVKHSKAPWDVDYRREIGAAKDDLQHYGDQMRQNIDWSDQLSKMTGHTKDETLHFLVAQQQSGRQFKTMDEALQAYNDDLKKHADKALQDAYDATWNLIDAQRESERTTDDVSDALENYRKQQKPANDDTRTAEERQKDLKRSMQDAEDQILRNVQATADYKVQTSGLKDESDKTRLKIQTQKEELQKIAKTLSPGDPLRKNLEGYIQKLDAIPPDKTTTFTFDAQSALAEIDHINQLLSDPKVSPLAKANMRMEITTLNNVVATLSTQAVTTQSVTNMTVDKMTVTNTGKRAEGGPVRIGQAYTVGEKRPELFIPDQNGWISPRVPSEVGGGGGLTPIQLQAILDRVMAAARPSVTMPVHTTESVDPMLVARELAWSLS